MRQTSTRAREACQRVCTERERSGAQTHALYSTAVSSLNASGSYSSFARQPRLPLLSRTPYAAPPPFRFQSTRHLTLDSDAIHFSHRKIAQSSTSTSTTRFVPNCAVSAGPADPLLSRLTLGTVAPASFPPYLTLAPLSCVLRTIKQIKMVSLRLNNSPRVPSFWGPFALGAVLMYVCPSSLAQLRVLQACPVDHHVHRQLWVDFWLTSRAHCRLISTFSEPIW